ncbi:ankyrin repeat-containing domain protein [Trichoderma barbatum]
MASLTIMMFLYFLFLGCAAADDGDDFSNNLFTDLGPLLALFGERVTMQFLSQAMGISDCIILSTAPLGIITVIVSAIRVGGPSWLKALIGRATENLAAAELELMSSTSNEVYEVIIIKNTKHAAPNISHNRGKNTGRGELRLAACFGILLQTGVVIYCGFITQYSKITSKFQKDGSPVGGYAFPLTIIGTVILNIGMFICAFVVESSTKEETFQPTENWKARLVWLQQKKTVGDQEFKSFALYTGEDQPNIITSSRKNHGEELDESDQKQWLGPKKLEVLTVTGTITSLIGFFAQFIGIRGMHWSVSVTSLVAVLIMTTLRALVRRGLASHIYSKDLRPGFELDWFADKLKDIENAPWYKDPDEPARKENLGSLEVGNTSAKPNEPNSPDDPVVRPDDRASTAQESETFVAKKCIAWRQSLAKLAGCRGPVSKEVMALTLAIEATMNFLDRNLEQEVFYWSCSIQASSADEQTIEFELTRRDDDGKWKANAGEIEAALSLRLFYVNPENEGQSSTGRTYSPFDDDKWLRVKGDASDVGIRILSPYTIPQHRHLQWWVPADGPQIWKSEAKYIAFEKNDSRTKEPNAIEEMEVEESRVVGLDACRQRIMRPMSEEEDHSNDGESAANFQVPGITTSPHEVLSCPFYHEPQRGKWRFRFGLSEDESEDSPEEESDDSSEEGSNNSSEEGSDDSTDIESEFMPYFKEAGRNSLLVIKSLDSLETLYAKDMFSAFMFAVAKSLKRPIGGNTDIQTSQATLGDHDSWKRLALRNDDISKLALAIQSTGLCNTHDAYISIISPLSMQQKLPEAATIVELVRDHAKEFEERHQWENACEVYWLLSLHLPTFAAKSYTHVRAVAVLATFRKTIKDLISGGRTSDAKDSGSKYTYFEKMLKKTMRNVNAELQHNLESLSKLQDADAWRESYRNIRGDFHDEYRDSISFNTVAISKKMYGTSCLWFEKGDAREKDIFDRTALHYCAALTDHEKSPYGKFWLQEEVHEDVSESIYARNILQNTRCLVEQGADIGARDISGWTPLHYACHVGNTSMARLFLEKGAVIVDVQSRDGTAPIHCAAKGGHSAIVDALLEYGANVDIADGFGNTALHEAAAKGSAKIVETLCKRGCRKTRNRQGRAAIHLAAVAGQYAIIDHFADDVNSKDNDGNTPLYHAAKFSHNNFVQRLLKLPNIDINPTADRWKKLPLHIACEKGHDDVVEALLDAGAPIDATHDGSFTPLYYAAAEERESTVKSLIARGANVKFMSNSGMTALHAAAITGNTAIVDHLLGEGADINAGAGLFEGTPLHAASRGVDDNPLIQHLIELGAEIDETKKGGMTPLHVAADKGKPTNIQLLVSKGANMEARDKWGCTPLLSTIQYVYARNKECLRLLIRLGADVNAADNTGRTSIHLTARNNYRMRDSIQELIKAGARIDDTDEDGQTALHVAAFWKCTKPIKVLVKHGANVEAADNKGQTPQMIAKERGLSDWWTRNISPSS